MSLKEIEICNPQNRTFWHKDYFELKAIKTITSRYVPKSGNAITGLVFKLINSLEKAPEGSV